MFDEQYVFRRDPSNSLAAVQTANPQPNPALPNYVPNVVVIGNVGNILGDYGNFNAPRTFGVEATVNF